MSSDAQTTRELILQATCALISAGTGSQVRMSDIARKAGVSRQAVYLHFANRTDLLIAALRYNDEQLDLETRLKPFYEAVSGADKLRCLIDFWADHVGKVYPLARVLMAMRDTDEDAAAAHDERLGAVREGCQSVANALHEDGELAAGWTVGTATDALWAMMSFDVWRTLTHRCGWSQETYAHHMQMLTQRSFIRSGGGGGN